MKWFCFGIADFQMFVAVMAASKGNEWAAFAFALLAIMAFTDGLRKSA